MALRYKRPAHSFFQMKRVLLLLACLSLAACHEPSAISRFTKSIYRELGDSGGNITSTVAKYQPEFDAINHDGRLGDTLVALFEIRLLELKTSIQHAKRMSQVIHDLNHNNAP